MALTRLRGAGIAANAVTAAAIAPGAVDITDIADGAIIAAKIANASIVLSGTKVTGTLPVANGGTGSTATPTAGGIVHGTGTAQAVSAAGTSGQPIVSGGASAPAFRPYTLPAADGSASQVLQTNGSGALSFATVGAGVGDHEVYVTTGNGYGSTNNKIERFSVTQRNVGTAITFADSASLGSSFTINEAGIYAIEYSGFTSSTDGSIGMSVNSTQLSTGINSITAANRICTTVTNASQTGQIFVATTALLAATDVVRPHVSNAGSNASVTTWFKIRKIGVAV